MILNTAKLKLIHNGHIAGLVKQLLENLLHSFLPVCVIVWYVHAPPGPLLLGFTGPLISLSPLESFIFIFLNACVRVCARTPCHLP